MSSWNQNTIHSDLRLFVDLTEELLRIEEEQPVAEYLEISDLSTKLDLHLPDEPSLDQELVDELKRLIHYTPKTASKMFFNQLFGGRHGKAMLGDLLAVVLNNSMYTYKAGGPQIQIEKELTEKIASMLGWGEDSLGTLAPGGSMTNLMGMLMARDAKFPDAVEEGMSTRGIVYTSQASHYSIQKNAAFAGIGRAQVRAIATNAKGRMDTKKLKTQIQNDIAAGLTPMLVNATAGTTVLGAFDPFEEIADICQAHEIWMHVDGAYCGSALLSKRYRHLISGAERADSFTLNAHKMLRTPLSCSLIIVKDKKHLYHSFSSDASYLYQTHDDDMNPGKISLQCGRRNDALKFWCLWKSIGTSGLEEMVDHQFDLAAKAREYVRDHPDYTLYSHDDTVSVCFNYKDIPAELLCNSLYEQSEIMVGFGSFREDTFVRLVTINSGNSHQDLQDFFAHLEAFAKKHLEVSVS